MKLKHYWMCSTCAAIMGGVYPEGHICTVTKGTCNYCDNEDVTLIPWIDFNWPKDEKSDKKAKGDRD